MKKKTVYYLVHRKGWGDPSIYSETELLRRVQVTEHGDVKGARVERITATEEVTIETCRPKITVKGKRK